MDCQCKKIQKFRISRVKEKILKIYLKICDPEEIYPLGTIIYQIMKHKDPGTQKTVMIDRKYGENINTT